MARHDPQHRTPHRDKRDKSADARGRILDAAEKLFAAHGYDATPTSHIAKEAGVPKGLLFYYFPAKFALLSALLTERFSSLDFPVADISVPGDPVKSLTVMASRYAQAQAESEVVRVIIWREEHTHPQAAATLAAHRATLESGIARVLEASLPATPPVAHLAAAAHLWAALLTATSTTATLENGTDALRTAAELLCLGLMAGEPSNGEGMSLSGNA